MCKKYLVSTPASKCLRLKIRMGQSKSKPDRCEPKQEEEEEGEEEEEKGEGGENQGGE